MGQGSRGPWIDPAVNATFELQNVEVDQKAKRGIRSAKITDKFGQHDIRHSLESLEFNDDKAFNQQIQPERGQLEVLVPNLHWNLLLNTDPATP
jgi:hypothetical protein